MSNISKLIKQAFSKYVRKEVLDSYAKTTDIPDVDNFVTTNTAQTITGTKRFTGDVSFTLTENPSEGCIISPEMSTIYMPGKTLMVCDMHWNDNDGLVFDADNAETITNTETQGSAVSLAGSPAADSNSSQIATTKWVNDKLSDIETLLCEI